MIPTLFALHAFAKVFTGGDGGHGVVCNDEVARGARNIMLLDAYEGRAIYHHDFEFIRDDPSDPSYPNVKGALKVARKNMAEITPLSPELEEIFVTAVGLLKNASFMPDTSFTHDVGAINARIPASCDLIQLGYYRVDGQRVRVSINSDAWPLMDVNEQAGLLLHEAFHRWFGAQESTLALRQIVAALGAPTKFRKNNRILLQRILATKQAADDSSFRIPKLSVH